jgi:hypothetical protein
MEAKGFLAIALLLVLSAMAAESFSFGKFAMRFALCAMRSSY